MSDQPEQLQVDVPNGQRSHHFVDRPERQCQGKVRYESKKDAKKGILKMQTHIGNTRGKNWPYRCPHCGYWHFGRIGGKGPGNPESPFTDRMDP